MELFDHSPIRVLCFGNRLHGDDGFGPRVYDALANGPLPAGVSVYDAGTAGLGSLLLLEGCSHLMIVDAMASRGQPGRLHRLTLEDVEETCPELSSHGQGVGYMLSLLQLMPEQPVEVDIFAAEVQEVTQFRQSLSPQVRAAVAPCVQAVRSRVAAWAEAEGHARALAAGGARMAGAAHG